MLMLELKMTRKPKLPRLLLLPRLLPPLVNPQRKVAARLPTKLPQVLNSEHLSCIRDASTCRVRTTRVHTAAAASEYCSQCVVLLRHQHNCVSSGYFYQAMRITNLSAAPANSARSPATRSRRRGGAPLHPYSWP